MLIYTAVKRKRKTGLPKVIWKEAASRTIVQPYVPAGANVHAV